MNWRAKLVKGTGAWFRTTLPCLLFGMLICCVMEVPVIQPRIFLTVLTPLTWLLVVLVELTDD